MKALVPILATLFLLFALATSASLWLGGQEEAVAAPDICDSFFWQPIPNCHGLPTDCYCEIVIYSDCGGEGEC